MKATFNHGNATVEFDGTTFSYSGEDRSIHSLLIQELPRFDSDPAKAFSKGTLHIYRGNEKIADIPFTANDVDEINKVLSAVNTVVFNYANKNVDVKNPDSVFVQGGLKISNSVFWVPALFNIASTTVPTDEVLHIALKGAFKEYLIVSDKTLYILKDGYMTGHLIGQGSFVMPLSSVTNTSVDFHLMSGYFSVATAGMENTRKNFWSSDKDMDPAKAPNTISLNAANKDDFVKAMQIINTQLIPKATQSTSQRTITMTALDPATEIRKFKGLLDDGIITQEEFDAKKKALLGL